MILSHLIYQRTNTVIIFAVILNLIILMGCGKDESKSKIDIKNQPDITLTGNILKLQGKWESKDDAAYTIEIKNNKFISLYNNEIVNSETIEFVNNNDERSADPDGAYFLIKDNEDAICFYLIKVNNRELEYSNVGRGNTLSFRKID